MDGLLPVWKPPEITSYDVIRIVKREVLKKLPGKVKIGHAGTLDPFAEGVLILMLGKATRQFDTIQGWKKTYTATVRLGSSSDTLDRTGTITSSPERIDAPIQRVRDVLPRFTGEIEQAIPRFSAAKYHGKALYTYARKGVVTPEKSKKVTVYSLEITSITGSDAEPHTEAEMRIVCSSGTYIRQLSYDIFRSLGVESYLVRLIRESVGEIDKKSCLTIEQLSDADTVRRRVLPVRDASASGAASL